MASLKLWINNVRKNEIYEEQNEIILIDATFKMIEGQKYNKVPKKLTIMANNGDLETKYKTGHRDNPWATLIKFFKETIIF